jgi:hypothetical protein
MPRKFSRNGGGFRDFFKRFTKKNTNQKLVPKYRFPGIFSWFKRKRNPQSDNDEFANYISEYEKSPPPDEKTLASIQFDYPQNFVCNEYDPITQQNILLFNNDSSKVIRNCKTPQNCTRWMHKNGKWTPVGDDGKYCNIAGLPLDTNTPPQNCTGSRFENGEWTPVDKDGCKTLDMDKKPLTRPHPPHGRPYGGKRNKTRRKQSNTLKYRKKNLY